MALAAYAASAGIAYGQCMTKSAWNCLRTAAFAQLSTASIVAVLLVASVPLLCCGCWRATRYFRSDCDYKTEDAFEQDKTCKWMTDKTVWIIGASSGSALRRGADISCRSHASSTSCSWTRNGITVCCSWCKYNTVSSKSRQAAGNLHRLLQPWCKVSPCSAF